MAVNETYELALIGGYHGQTVITTHHFREVTPVAGPPDPEQQLIDDWQAALQVAWRNMFNATYSLLTIRSRKVCGTLPLPQATEEGVNVAGTRGVAAVNEWPAWMALLVTERTGLAGRSYRGRYFLPGVCDTDVDGDNFTTGAGVLWTLAGTYNDALLATFGPSGTNPDWRLVVHSRKLAEVPGTQCQQSSTPVTALIRSIKPATMKSRK